MRRIAMAAASLLTAGAITAVWTGVASAQTDCTTPSAAPGSIAPAAICR